MTRDLLTLFLRKEVRDLRANRQLWPAFLIFPVLAVTLPVLLIALLPVLTDPAIAEGDPGLKWLLEQAAAAPGPEGASVAERLVRILLRELGALYLLMPVVLSSTAAALAIVREKEQRTLEPILATPIGDRELLLAKLVAALVPAVMVTWLSAAAGSLSGLVGAVLRVGAPIAPTAGVMVTVLLLAPALAAAAALQGMHVSARMTDAQAAMQYTGLVVVPVTLILVVAVGRAAVGNAAVAALLAALAGWLAWMLFRRNLRRFRRDRILTSWR